MKRTSLIWPAPVLLAAGLLVAGCKDAPQGTASQAAAATRDSAAAATLAPAGDAAPAPAATTPTSDPAAAASGGKVHKLASGLVYEDLVVGDGKMADPGLTVVVQYTGWLTNGTKFDSSLDHGKPLTFVLGQHTMIEGWEQGVRGMRVGGKRKLTIPPDLGFGQEGSGSRVPPNSTLIFEIQLLDVQ